MEVKGPNGDTPLEASLAKSKRDKDFPERLPGRQDVATFIKSEGLEDSQKSLAELASRQIWFVVKNLVRRQVVPASEFGEKAFRKTAVEWAEHFGEEQMAKELRYYASLPSAELLDMKEKVENLDERIEELEAEVSDLENDMADQKEKTDELKDELAAKEGRIDVLQNLLIDESAALATAEAEASKHKEQVTSLQEQCAAYAKKVRELSETVAALTSHLPGEASNGANEPAPKKPKLDTNESGFGSDGEDGR